MKLSPAGILWPLFRGPTPNQIPRQDNALTAEEISMGEAQELRPRKAANSGAFFMLEKETADFLRVHQRSLQRWRCEGTGPKYRKHGHRVLYARDDVIAWSESTAATSTTNAAA
jgi:hypothetical protein